MNPSQSVADVTDHNPTLLLTLRTQGIHRLQSLSLRSLGFIALDGRTYRHFVLRIVTVLTYTVSSHLSGVSLDLCEVSVVREHGKVCLLYTSPSPRDGLLSRMPSSA